MESNHTVIISLPYADEIRPNSLEDENLLKPGSREVAAPVVEMRRSNSFPDS
jgi:hypothetical protein